MSIDRDRIFKRAVYRQGDLTEFKIDMNCEGYKQGQDFFCDCHYTSIHVIHFKHQLKKRLECDSK